MPLMFHWNDGMSCSGRCIKRAVMEHGTHIFTMKTALSLMLVALSCFLNPAAAGGSCNRQCQSTCQQSNLEDMACLRNSMQMNRRATLSSMGNLVCAYDRTKDSNDKTDVINAVSNLKATSNCRLDSLMGDTSSVISSNPDAISNEQYKILQDLPLDDLLIRAILDILGSTDNLSSFSTPQCGPVKPLVTKLTGIFNILGVPAIGNLHHTANGALPLLMHLGNANPPLLQTVVQTVLGPVGAVNDVLALISGLLSRLSNSLGGLTGGLSGLTGSRGGSRGSDKSLKGSESGGLLGGLLGGGESGGLLGGLLGGGESGGLLGGLLGGGGTGGLLGGLLGEGGTGGLVSGLTRGLTGSQGLVSNVLDTVTGGVGGGGNGFLGGLLGGVLGRSLPVTSLGGSRGTGAGPFGRSIYQRNNRNSGGGMPAPQMPSEGPGFEITGTGRATMNILKK